MLALKGPHGNLYQEESELERVSHKQVELKKKKHHSRLHEESYTNTTENAQHEVNQCSQIVPIQPAYSPGLDFI